MRRLLLILAFLLIPAYAFAQHDTTGASAAHGAETEAHEAAHPDEAPHTGGGGHAEKTYFGIPGWILKLANMLLFIGVLVYFIGGPVKKAFRERGEAIRRAADEARERREKADRIASDIQARLGQIEQEVVAIRERAVAEGERQKREMIAAAEAEAAKILDSARNDVENRIKNARHDLAKYAGQLASDRAEAILRERMTDTDQQKLFQESVRELGEVAR
ncbi:MAG TPA: ATP synthase F0 subunit B [Thermoanaerobaculia bacterium]|jgi:F-type H+-transporting ATPase subunit b